MTAGIARPQPGIYDPTTGRLTGLLGADSKEYGLPMLAPQDFPYVDSSGTPGGATQNSYKGKAAIAAAASSVVITNSLVTATSLILATLESNDATLLYIKSVVPAAGSFTVTGNAAATAATSLKYVVVN